MIRGPRPIAGLLCLALLSLHGGCKDDVSATSGDKLQNLSVEKGRLFVLELEEKVTVSKVQGGDDATSLFKQFAIHNHLLLYTHPDQKNVLRLGVTAPAASYGESTYERIRVRADHRVVYLPSANIELTKDDGSTIHVNFSDARLVPSELPSDGIIRSDFSLEGAGDFTIRRGDTFFSGDFTGRWSAIADERDPEVIIVPPAKGLVSGSFDVYFDEPVTAEQIASKIFLRDKKGEQLNISVEVRETDIPNFTTHIRVETANLLPFNDRLTLAVGTGFSDLVGNKVTKPKVEVVQTPDYPPAMNNVGHDFDAARGKKEFSYQGDVTLADHYLGLKGHAGRLAVLRPPSAGSRYSSALLARIRIPADAVWLQVRVRKVARNRDAKTPCLRYVLAQIDNGQLWNVECGPTDVPGEKFAAPDGAEYFTTDPFTLMNINVVGQRAREVVLVLEAKPLASDMNVETDPVFLVDMIRMVWEGEDPKSFGGDLQMAPP